jgi:hypothetical protein
MFYCKEILICILIIVLLPFLLNKSSNLVNLEKFEDTGNYVYTNQFDIANALEYGAKPPKGAFSNNSPTMGPSSTSGVGQSSGTDNYDDRGYKWTQQRNGYDVNVDSSMMDDTVMRDQFQNMYMLDPTGSVEKYDISNMPVSKHCCTAQYSVPFMEDNNNCDYANKYVANNYMGMNYSSEGNGCPCMTPDQAAFFTKRGGNTSIA